MDERRREKRHVVTFPVVVESKSRYSFVTITKNAAKKGLLLMTAARLEKDEPVNIVYRVKGDQPTEHEVTGRIVRVEKNSEASQDDYPFLAAIEFTGPLPELEKILEDRVEDESSDD